VNKLIAALTERRTFNTAEASGAAPAPVNPAAPIVTDTGAAAVVEPLIGEAETPPQGDGASSPPPEEPALSPEILKLPEGVELDQESLGKFFEVLNNKELSRAELAQNLVDLQLAVTAQAQEALQQAGEKLWTDTQNTWREEAKALPEIGGDALPATLATINKGLKAVGATAATFEALKFTGAGNHPEIIRVMHALTKSLVEQPGPTSGNPPGGPIDPADRMFGKKG
jgi:hypothetical protein